MRDLTQLSISELQDLLQRLNAELSQVNTRHAQTREVFFRVSEQARGLTAELEAVESLLTSQRASLREFTRDWIPERLTLGRERASLRRIRERNQRRLRLVGLSVVEQFISLSLIRDAEAGIAEVNEELASLRAEFASLRMDVTASGVEAAELRREIGSLPDVGGLLAELRRLEAERDRLEDEIARVEEELETRYLVVEYTKFYKYPKPPRAMVQRNFEIRAEFTVPQQVDPADLLDVIGEKFDDVMIELGITALDAFEQGWIVGGRVVGETDEFADLVFATVHERVMGYIYTSPRFPTEIDVSEGELTV